MRPALLLAVLSSASCAASTPESRAAAFLSREVREWPAKNKCFSCHNNGDAARALYTARSGGIAVDPAALEATGRFLSRPEAWKENGPDVEYSDKRLATLQFAFALATSESGGAALAFAAGQVRAQQEPDGSWTVDAGGLPGSPVTWGRTLATALSRRVLVAAGRDRFGEAIDRADAWLRRQRPAGVLDSAAALLGGGPRDPGLDVLRRGQTRDGGWGPFVTSPPEVFDTAVALLALAGLRDQPGVPEMIRRGRRFLIDSQRGDGSWPETTRPPGAESYAQRISTTAWAMLALLATGSD